MSDFIKTFEVKSEHSAKAMGSGDLEVLATPALVAFMEDAAKDHLKEDLENGQTSVGSEFHIHHLRPTALGAQVECRVTLEVQEGHIYVYSIEAYDDRQDQAIARASHQRVVVDAADFMDRLA